MTHGRFKDNGLIGFYSAIAIAITAWIGYSPNSPMMATMTTGFSTHMTTAPATGTPSPTPPPTLASPSSAPEAPPAPPLP